MILTKKSERPFQPALGSNIMELLFEPNDIITEQLIADEIRTTVEKKIDRQNNICQSVAPSKDLTIKPPKLRQKAPRNIKIGPGILIIEFILFD